MEEKNLDLSTILEQELSKRVHQNPHYSLRAFARLINVDPSTLSQVLRKKRTLSKKLSAPILAKLGVVQSPDGVESVFEATKLTADVIAYIGEWHHHAIFELASTQNFVRTPFKASRFISKELGISMSAAKDALDRLMRLGLLDRHLKPTSKNLTTTGIPGTTTALRNWQRQVLEKAIRALDEVSIEERDQSSLCVAINRRRLPEAKALIARFRRELNALADRDLKKNSVYQLGVSFYPLTKGEKK